MASQRQINENPENPDLLWTVMVYQAGDNNLSEEMIYATKEMYRVGVTEKFDVIIQFDPSGIGAPVRRHVISSQQATRQGLVVRKLDEDGQLGATATPLDTQSIKVPYRPVPVRSRKNALKNPFENSADPRVVREFIFSSIERHRAPHYMIVLSGHGSGAEGDFLKDDRRADDVPAPDTPPSSSLSIPSLGWVLRDAKEKLKELKRQKGVSEDEIKKARLDILGMDSCLMSTVEVCHEVRDSVKFLVASEGFELNTGWPYQRILEELREIQNPERLAEKIVATYIKYYTDYDVAGASTDLSACNLESFDTRLVPAVKGLAKSLQSGLTYRALKDAILLAHWEAQSYKREQYVDLFDFCHRLQLRCEGERDFVKALQGQKGKSWELLYGQLNSQLIYDELKPEPNEIIDALQASRTNGDVRRAWQLIHDRLDPEQKADVDHLANENDVSGAWQLIIDQLGNVAEACQGVKDAIEKDVIEDGKVKEPRVVLKSCYSGPAFQHSHGLSVYFPWFEDKEVLLRYEKLGFGEDTGWAAFLKKYLKATRRERRNQGTHMGEDPVRIDPPDETLQLVREGPPHTRGFVGTARSMKNPPDGFYRGDCTYPAKHTSGD